MKNMKKNSSTVYQGYKIRRQNKPDDLLTDSNFGTPLGEYMRCFWQPVALAAQVTRLPKKLKIFKQLQYIYISSIKAFSYKLSTINS